MNYTVFNREVFDAKKEFMFFGKPVSTARFDEQKHKVFEDLTEKTLGFFWRPQEISVKKDAKDFRELPEHEQRIFLLNLKYQTLLDSVQGRSPNVCLLPIVSLPELENWIETWSFSECLAEGTEVLTLDGWKDLGKTTVEDSCAVYDLGNDKIHFEKPKRVVEYDVDTHMVSYEANNGKQFSQLVTPNHRMPVIHRDKRKDGTQNRYFKEAMLQKYQSHHLAPVAGFLEDGKGISDHERLLIALQADGSLSDRYTGERCGTLPAWFSFSKQRKIDRLKELCDKLGYELTELSDDNRSSSEIKTKKRFKVNIPVNQVISKTFDWVNIENASLNWCKDFLEELAEWDSHKIKDSFTYSSVIKSNVDIVQAVAALCGRHARLSLRKDERKDTYNDLYSVNVVNRFTKDGQSIEAEYVPYKGKVRCLETSTGAFLIRYNGVVSVTGNTIHSRSYTHIIRSVLPNPSEVFDSILLDDKIINRAEAVTKYYDDLHYWNCLRETGDKYSEYEHKKSLYLCLHSIAALEAVRFYVSFACSFSFAERDLMNGNADIIKLICRDEAMHWKGTQYMINSVLNGKDDPELMRIHKECEEEVTNIWLDANAQEKDWGEYLFKDGSMIGLNKQILWDYIDYITDQRMRSVQLKSPFKVGKNPLPWMTTWTNTSNVQTTPQAKELTSYITGGLDSDMNDTDFAECEL